MAVPKGKTTSGKRNQRRAQNFKITMPNLVKCPTCGELVRSHTACKSCGSYNRREVYKVAEN